jgi:hypothetical protein
METASTSIFGRLENMSDWLSPIVVKEVRQIVRGREFLYSFAISLVAGLVVASLGGTSSIEGNTTAGATIFGWLMTCLTIVGIVVVPVGTFMALRNERMERTFDLIMLTTLPPRRVVIGKILAQAVKLVTLFAALAPFMAMSFLLGGIDLVTILISLGMLFLWSLWACAACLFLSSAVKSRAMSGAMLALMGFGYLLLLIGGGGAGISYMIRSSMYGGGYPGYYGGPGGSFWAFGGSASSMFWGISVTVSLCLVTMSNLVFLAENCLALEDEDRSFPLRVGLFAQFLMIIGWTFIPPLILPAGSGFTGTNAFYLLCGVGGAQLIIESLFMTTENLVLSRRTLLRDRPTRFFSWLTVIFRPGGGRAVAYLLTKMALLILFAFLMAPTNSDFRWALAFCGYIALFTGVPVYVARLISPQRSNPLKLRLAMLLTFLAALLLPELARYFMDGPINPKTVSLRVLLNPVLTLGDWDKIGELSQTLSIGLGLLGLFAYVRLIMLGRRLNKPAVAKAMAANAR